MPVSPPDCPAGAFVPINSATRQRTMSPTSSVSSSDGRKSADHESEPFRSQSPSSPSTSVSAYYQPACTTPSSLSVPHPPVGTTPTTSFRPTAAAELSPYTPPHPTPQDTLDATVKPIETAPPKNRRRRNRTIYSEIQLRGLEACFRLTRYPDITTRESLAISLGMTEARVQVWFQNRRARLRREERNRRRSEEENSEDARRSDDVIGSDVVSSSRRLSSMTSEQDGVDHQEQEIDVVSVSGENDSVFHSQSADPSVTSNLSASSLVGSPLISIAPPEVCTKPCCCPPVVTPPSYSCYPFRFPPPLPYYRGYYAAGGLGLPPLPGLSLPASLVYGYPPSYSSIAYRLPTVARTGTPESSS